MDKKNYLKKYSPPKWAENLKKIPKFIIPLAHLPTPIEEFDIKLKGNFPNSSSKFYIKRDDLTEFLLSGNKVRKLEFLVAEAIEKECDCIITVGPLQSNHCRATAVAARKKGIDPYLILRTDNVNSSSLTYDGNVLIDRYMNSKFQLVSVKEYKQKGPVQLTLELKEKLIKEGRKPYVIPMGGSNSLGTWGYLNFIQELIDSEIHHKIDEIVFAIGSGGTAAGIALGVKLSGLKCKVTAFSVCDSSKYFHQQINEIYHDLGVEYKSEDLLEIIDDYITFDVKREHQLIKELAQNTGIIIDPVYTIKAINGMIHHEKFKSKTVLFVHTGGYFQLESRSKLIEELKIFD